MMNTNKPKRLKKSVTFQEVSTEKNGYSSDVPEHTEDLTEEFEMEMKKGSIFKAERSQFMSLNHSKSQRSNSYHLQPVDKLAAQVTRMEESLIQTEKYFTQKLRNLGRKMHRENEKEMKLTEEILFLRNELNKNLALISELREKVSTNNIEESEEALHEEQKENEERIVIHRKYQRPSRLFTRKKSIESVESKICEISKMSKLQMKSAFSLNSPSNKSTNINANMNMRSKMKSHI